MVYYYCNTISPSHCKANGRIIINTSFFDYEQRDTNGLNSENNELKLRLQTMEQQVHLQDGKIMLLMFFEASFQPLPLPPFLFLSL